MNNKKKNNTHTQSEVSSISAENCDCVETVLLYINNSDIHNFVLPLSRVINNYVTIVV